MDTQGWIALAVLLSPVAIFFGAAIIYAIALALDGGAYHDDYNSASNERSRREARTSVSGGTGDSLVDSVFGFGKHRRDDSDDR